MAKKQKDINENTFKIADDKNYKRQISGIGNLISKANLTVYGTDKDKEIKDLNNKFHEILSNEINTINKGDNEDITSFLGKLVSNDNKKSAINDMLDNQFLSLGGNSGDDYSTIQTFIYEAYKNRLLEQSDLHEVSSQLIELREAIEVMRDAIISADIVDGRMNRMLKIENTNDEESENVKSIIENMEKKFDLQNKIKNFIVPNTLEYGEYYVYMAPYSKLFDDFMKNKENDTTGRYIIRESTVLESFDENSLKEKHHANKNNISEDDFQAFCEKTYEDYYIQEKTKYKLDENKNASIISKEDFSKDLKNILENISICNDNVPLPILDEGIGSFEYMKEQYETVTTEANDNENLFSKISKAKMTPDGITFEDPTANNNKKKKSKFDDITGCYIKLIEPTRIMPIQIMDTVIGYYYVQDEDITPLSGAISNTLYYSKFDEHSKETTVLDAIATRVIKSFDKKFLKDNVKFKKTIIDCINYYNLNEKKLKFQFIPVEYIQEFKIDVDVKGRGQSMIKKSLFYAKLYLMLLLFKIMSILLYSNDQKVNYIKQSGIDKNVANKVQEIARIKQSRQINISDLFSYTTLINKVGNGSEMYIPTGRSGERPIETEILSGQEVQLNTELMEMLKNAYILGTGVPPALLNYLYEPEFAKIAEQNNSKMNGRVVNYQLDFNPCITSMYQKLLSWNTNLQQSIIDNFSFVLQPPKTVSINTKSEMIGQFQGYSDFLVQLLYDDPSQSMNAEEIQKEIKEFKKLLAAENLPIIDMDKVNKLRDKAHIIYIENKLKPDPSNGDNGDDDGLLEDELGEDVGLGGNDNNLV